MGFAYEVRGGAVTNSAAGTGVTFATGDSGAVRNFQPPASCKLEFACRKGATAGFMRIRSPLLHDNVQGLRWQTDANPRAFLLPREGGELLQPQDTLTVEANSGAADSTVVVFGLNYTDLPGAAARLHSWGDISGIIEHYKTVEVDLTAAAALGQWSSTAVNATQDLLEANSDYAVLGYTTDTAVAGIAVSAPDTANFRVGGPGTLDDFDHSDYFVRMSELHGTPHIPVINSANKGNWMVSHIDNVAGTTPKVTLVLALLTQNLPS